MVNLLIITNNPSRPSFRQRIGLYTNILQDNNIICKVKKFPSGYFARQKLLKQSKDFDAVFLHKKKLNFLDASCLRRYAKKVIYDFDDAIMYRDNKPDKLSRKRFNAFKRTIKLANVIIAGNNYLADHARQFNSNITVIPTGLDIKSYKHTKNSPDDMTRLVWIGSKSTIGYLMEIKDVLEEIGSKFDKVVLRIICDEFFDLENMPVEKHRWYLQTQADDLAACDIGLAPLPDNSFTRGKCGFKILQYQASALPVIASPVGANAEYVHDGIDGFLVNDRAGWIEKISLLLRNSQLRRPMAEKAGQKVLQFDIEQIGKQLCDLLKATSV